VLAADRDPHGLADHLSASISSSSMSLALPRPISDRTRSRRAGALPTN
jgi:hypothetical protein